MSKTEINEKVQKIADEVSDELRLELVHAEVVGAGKQTTVRVFIDKAVGVTHEDCALFSRAMEKKFDSEDFIDSEYTLEVSSPGLERELYSLKDFEKFAGNLAKVKTRTGINNQRNFRGRIKAVENSEIVFDDKTSGEVRFSFDAVAKANLEIDIEEEFRRGADRAKEEKS